MCWTPLPGSRQILAWRPVTILSDNSAQGDAPCPPTCLLLGPEEGMQLIESLDGVEALFITTDGEHIPPPAMRLTNIRAESSNRERRSADLACVSFSECEGVRNLSSL